MVAMSGWIMPEPLAMPATVTSVSPRDVAKDDAVSRVVNARRASPRAIRATARSVSLDAVTPLAPSGFEGHRLAHAAVADALTTAFMVLTVEEISALCERSPGLEAWILPDGELPGAADLLYFGGPAERVYFTWSDLRPQELSPDCGVLSQSALRKTAGDE